MLSHPAVKYSRPATVQLPDREWPNRTIDRAPVWLSTDLRDGNQALFEPMSRERKLSLFQALVRVGFKEIEVGFPSASQIDFDVVRDLVAQDLIPDDVTPMVITQARADLIERTVQSLAGARRAIVHLYNATSPLWRRVVFDMSVEQVMQLIEEHVSLLRRLTSRHPETQWTLQYSPETFCMTELEVSLLACNTAIRAWDAGPGRKIIINLPTTVEVTTANVFADQIEWMNRRLERREHVVLSVHPHNDRGTGVACAEQALLAGAERVEGCLFGNGERSGNVDLVTLALNLYTHGIHPRLDLSDINGLARLIEESTGLPIHPRHPYVGDLVFTAFSGSHQDAIKKGMAAQRPNAPWAVPYLPIDPVDIGRSYDGIIRVNAQSGKGGIAYLLEQAHGVVMPRRMQIELSSVVQRAADASEAEISAEVLWRLFDATYLAPPHDPRNPLAYASHRLEGDGERQSIELELGGANARRMLRGSGNGPIDAAVRALGLPLTVHAYEERSLGAGADAAALAIVEISCAGMPGTRFGAGRHGNLATASILALLSAASRVLAEAPRVAGSAMAAVGSDAAQALSAREIEVLQWSAEGKSAGDLATILGISERTVNFHVQQAMQKLNAPNKISAVYRATVTGVLGGGGPQDTGC
ncbi:2-isopropylmalate synthase [uncultured Azohydromonas sp.]|jgi:Isopropylmalate/homocitrate/citramalate synthases|uniref:2-isopropylmalate synthase n=1 Tax=uncultured Azohydromonas sp. TaxID=487342 RepID=UPI00263A2463|nr:2-isopropylmalate synthase [uncultured Azohydromonas sp.]